MMHTDNVHLDHSIFFYKPRFRDFVLGGKFVHEEFDFANYPDSICNDTLVRACVRPSAIRFVDKRVYQKKLFRHVLNLFGLRHIDPPIWNNSCFDFKLLLAYNENRSFAQDILAYECIQTRANLKYISMIGDEDYFYFIRFPLLNDFDLNGKFAEETFDTQDSRGEILSDNIINHCVHPFFISMPTLARSSCQKFLFEYITSLFGMHIKYDFDKNRDRLVQVFERVSSQTPQQLKLTHTFFSQRQKVRLNFSK